MPVPTAGLRPASMDIARTACAGAAGAIKVSARKPSARTGRAPVSRPALGRLRDRRLDPSSKVGEARLPATDTARLNDVPLPVLLLLVTMLVPRELEVNIGISASDRRRQGKRNLAINRRTGFC